MSSPPSAEGGLADDDEEQVVMTMQQFEEIRRKLSKQQQSAAGNALASRVGDPSHWRPVSSSKLWAWGGGAVAPGRPFPAPVPLGQLGCRRIASVSAAFSRAAIITETGDVYMWENPLSRPSAASVDDEARRIQQSRPDIVVLPSAALAQPPAIADSSAARAAKPAALTSADAVRIATTTSRWVLDHLPPPDPLVELFLSPATPAPKLAHSPGLYRGGGGTLSPGAGGVSRSHTRASASAGRNALLGSASSAGSPSPGHGVRQWSSFRSVSPSRSPAKATYAGEDGPQPVTEDSRLHSRAAETHSRRMRSCLHAASDLVRVVMRASSARHPPPYLEHLSMATLSAATESLRASLYSARAAVRSIQALRGPAGRVVQVACGEQHCLARTAAGEVFSWGSGLHGRLGHGLTSDEPSPRLVTRLIRNGARASWVACGQRHSAAVTLDGGLYMWGSGKLGRLATDKPGDRRSPTHVAGTGGGEYDPWMPGYLTPPPRKDEEVATAAGGAGAAGRTASASSASGAASGPAKGGKSTSGGWIAGLPSWMGGSSKSKRQDDGSAAASDAAEAAAAAAVAAAEKEWSKGVLVWRVACGNMHTVAVSRDGKVFAWGAADDGQTGTGSDSRRTVYVPRLVRLPDTGSSQSRSRSGTDASATGSRVSAPLSPAGRAALADGPAMVLAKAARASTSAAIRWSEWRPKRGVTDVACGATHTVVSLVDGRCFAWGSDEYGQVSASPLPARQAGPSEAGGQALPPNGHRRVMSPLEVPVEAKSTSVMRHQRPGTRSLLQGDSHKLDAEDAAKGDAPAAWSKCSDASLIAVEDGRIAGKLVLYATPSRIREALAPAFGIRPEGVIRRSLSELGGFPPSARRVLWPALAGNRAHVTPELYREALRSGRALVSALLRSQVSEHIGRLRGRAERIVSRARDGQSAAARAPPGVAPIPSLAVRAGISVRAHTVEGSPLLRSAASLGAIPVAQGSGQSPHRRAGSAPLADGGQLAGPAIIQASHSGPAVAGDAGASRPRLEAPLGAWAEAFLLGGDDPTSAEADAAAAMEAYFEADPNTEGSGGDGGGNLAFLFGDDSWDERPPAGGEGGSCAGSGSGGGSNGSLGADAPDGWAGLLGVAQATPLGYSARMDPAEAAGALATISGALAGPAATAAAGPSLDQRRRIKDVATLLRDLKRTHSRMRLLDSGGPLRRDLVEVFVALIGVLTDLGYSQAMGLQVTPILLHTGSPYLTFQVYLNLLLRPEMRLIFRGEGSTSSPESRAHQLYINRRLGKICLRGVQSQGLSCSDSDGGLYVTSWFSGFFTKQLPLDQACDVMDFYLVHGAQAVVGVVVACHKLLQPVLCEISAQRVAEGGATLAEARDVAEGGVLPEVLNETFFASDGAPAVWAKALAGKRIVKEAAKVMEDLPDDVIGDLDKLLNDPFLLNPGVRPEGLGPLESAPFVGTKTSDGGITGPRGRMSDLGLQLRDQALGGGGGMWRGGSTGRRSAPPPGAAASVASNSASAEVYASGHLHDDDDDGEGDDAGSAGASEGGIDALLPPANAPGKSSSAVPASAAQRRTQSRADMFQDF
ncbi:hypothetical protein FNF28_04595 [Cafeteria roenbergensis]|uniref:Rab-GAP TBC domain-containing protein n=1 Tax=Cafeteria roenbergensis TaxID=33653 RepID=A0A5A8DDL7_CAFRO|nr:hypothetical protein FNF28_04595 [Cafeteria roenbergensis]